MAAMHDVKDLKLQGIQAGLLDWFRDYGRAFPWRQTRNPYKILLAEKLLQQTSVRQDLVEAYQDLVTTYPTFRELAEADVDNILSKIQSLGLHYRAQEIVTLAKEICHRHNGEIPQDFKSLMALPGVGDYTARAVLCFAFGQDVPVVDTNVARILYRLFGLPGVMPANPARKRSLIELAGTLMQKDKARELNLAIIDLGALVCKSSRPYCTECPLQKLCAYYLSGGKFYET